MFPVWLTPEPLRAGLAFLQGLGWCPGLPVPLFRRQWEGGKQTRLGIPASGYFPNNFIEMCQEYMGSTNV